MPRRLKRNVPVPVAVRHLSVPNAADVVTISERALKGDVSRFKGSIVRIKPSHGVEEDELRTLVARLDGVALAYKCLPRPPGDRLVLQEIVEPGNTVLPSNPRELVRELLESSSSRQKDRLANYLEEIADRCGV